MKELTQAMAERCARACGWRFQDLHFDRSPEALKHCDHGMIVPKGWKSPDGRIFDGLELDPLFWFGRLWVRLKEIVAVNKKNWNVELHCNDSLHTVWIEYSRPTGEGRDEIEALCAAIEARREGK